MPDGGQLLIALSNASANAVEIEVTDSGMGMTEAVRQRIFEPFFTTKSIGEGTGLGLATVHGIVAQHTGTVTVRSQLGQGSSFTIRFPRVDLEPAALPARPAQSIRGQGELILIIEDERSVRQTVVRFLESIGYVTVAAGGLADAQQALRTLERGVDLILSDVILHGENGPDTVLTLRKSCPAARVLFMSGYSDGAAFGDAYPEPHPQVLAKPFRNEHLAQLLRELLDDSSQAVLATPR